MRKTNGFISLALAALLVVHVAHNLARLGAGTTNEVLQSLFPALSWMCVVLSILHIGLSGGTSATMLNDTERPPSPRKKRHLVLKWATGIALALSAGLHIGHAMGFVAHGSATFFWGSLLATLVFLGMHTYTGARSLLKDIGLPTSWKTAVRVVVVVCTFAACAALLAVAA